MSSSTPRPAMPLPCLSIELCNAPRGVMSLDGIPVVELVVVEDVRERVPLRRGLQRHHHVVVGVAKTAGHVFLRAPGRGHEVQRVLPDPAAGLRAELVERDAEIENLARAHEARRRHHAVGCDQVGGAALVVGAPTSPVAQPFTHRPEVVHPRTLPNSPTGVSRPAMRWFDDASSWCKFTETTRKAPRMNGWTRQK